MTTDQPTTEPTGRNAGADGPAGDGDGDEARTVGDGRDAGAGSGRAGAAMAAADNALSELSAGFVGRLVVRAGVGAWCLVGIVVVLTITVSALTSVSSVVMPLLFGVVLAVLFRPAAAWLERRRVPKPLAAGSVVLALVVVVLLVIVLTVKGVLDQSTRLGDLLGPALDRLGVDAGTADQIRASVESMAPSVSQGFLKAFVGGISTIGGFIAGAVLGVLIMYYLLKDGDSMRAWLVGKVDVSERPVFDGFLDDATIVLRRYGRGRTILSAIVALAVGAAGVVLGLPLVLTIVVVNFVGGYVPYIGAVAGGGLAVLVALADGGVPDAVVMLAVVLAANLLLENFVEPKVMGRTLDIHPVVVLVVTAVGGIVGGLVGLMLAVPITVLITKAFARARSADAVRVAAGRALTRVGLRQPATPLSPDPAPPSPSKQGEQG